MSEKYADRKWCFTLKYIGDENNINFDQFDNIYSQYKDIIRYMIPGYEIGEAHASADDEAEFQKDGKKSKQEVYKHWQGYIQFFEQKNMKGIKGMFNRNDIHLGIQKSAINDHARWYCWKGQFIKRKDYKGKEEEYYNIIKNPQPSAIFKQYGNYCKGQGYRTDLNNIRNLIDTGQSHYEIVQHQGQFNSYARYHSWFFKYKMMRDEQTFSNIRRNVFTNVIYGDTGVGKTTYVLDKYGCGNVYILQNPKGDNKNWNGYTNQKILLIDDFNGWIGLPEMLRILDDNPYICRKLNSSCYAQWTDIYITSNTGPKEWYEKVNTKEYEALLRRIKKCHKVTKGNTNTLVICSIDYEDQRCTDFQTQEYITDKGLDIL